MPSFAEVMALLIKKRGGNVSQISRDLGLKKDGKPRFSSQLIGQYRDGDVGKKGVNMEFVQAWKDAFGDDIMGLMKGFERTAFQHEIFEGDYVGLHKNAWSLFEDAMRSDKELLKDLAATLKNLTQAGGNQ